MNFRNLKIGMQLKLGFGAMLLFVIVLGAVAYRQSGQLHLQTETMYDHPVKTQRTLREITSNILFMRINIRDYLLVKDIEAQQGILNKIAVNQSDVLNGIERLRVYYLGPPKDIDDLTNELAKWNSILQETIRMETSGKQEEARQRHIPGGIGPAQAQNVLAALQKISDFAINKGDQLYANSLKLNDSLNLQLLLLVSLILIFSLIINTILFRNISNPLSELTEATRRFREGDRNSRSSYVSANELGILSGSFNSLAESIQDNLSLNQKVVSLASLMLSKYEAKDFFRETLNALAVHTNSQMAAIYLLSDDKKTYEHFDSIGLDDKARLSFDALNFEGEFGALLVSRKVQHIKNIPDDTRFVFHTVSGRFIPHEIITIPVLSQQEVIAIISFASVSSYDNQAIQLIESILDTLNARIEGIIAYHKMLKFSEMLQHQNRELESRDSELSAKSVELMGQNIELEIQKRQLHEASRLKTNFLSNMSHELRTPLNSVIALSGVLSHRLEQKIPEEEYGFLEVIERNGKHLLSLINDILDISRIEAGREEIDLSEFNANDLIADVISMIQPQAQQKNIELLLNTGNSGFPVTSDADKCRHILINLVGNAVKFTEKGQVSISAEQSDTNFDITVTDTGIGISEKNLPYIFNEFRQADVGTSRKFGGTGLGLAIAKKYANLLGGTISAKSTPGKGSEFKLSLPLHYAAENRVTEAVILTRFKPENRPIPHQLISGSFDKTILLVDDSEPAIIEIKDILMESGYKLLYATNGHEAIEILAQSNPDGIILDLLMPGMDGFEVLRIIREQERTAHIPVLILTAKHITKEELLFLKQNRIHELIQKGSVNSNELISAVDSMVFPETTAAKDSPEVLHPIPVKPLVLVVEDNPDNMTTVKAILAGNYTVIEALDGIEAVEMARKHQPDLILMDIDLPKRNGIAAFKIIRKDAALQHIPVIALTASAMVADRETILAEGMDAYIPKPIDEMTFFKTINSVLYGK
jgi:signal transduction histidine kinase/CheY-like chemotaxis protein/HAMP domain-containing protein